MSGVINTGNFAKAIYPGLSKIFGDVYTTREKQYTQLFEVLTSKRAYEEGMSISGYGLAAEKTEGDAITYDTASQGFINRLVHKTYASGYIVTQEMIEDNLYDISVIGKKESKALALSMTQTLEILAANVYNKAFTGQGITYGDGKELLVSDHPNKAGGTFSNIASVASDLSEAALEQAVIDIAGFRNDRGLLVKIMPKSLIVSKEQMFEAERIMKTQLRYDTANNDLNALRTMGYFKEIVINYFLTDPDAWFIRTDCPDGMTMYMRKPITFEMDNDFDTNNAKFKAYFRASFGVYDPRGIYGSPGK